MIYFIEKQKLKYLKRKTSCTWELELLNKQLKFMSKKMKIILNLREICHILPSLQYWFLYYQMSRFKYEDYLSQIWSFLLNGENNISSLYMHLQIILIFKFTQNDIIVGWDQFVHEFALTCVFTQWVLLCINGRGHN